MLSKSIKSKNRVLASLSRADLAALEPHLESAPLAVNEVLGSAGKRMVHAYFPVSGLVSLVQYVADGSGVEVGMVGPESFVGVAELLGGPGAPHETMVQIAGAAQRIPAARLYQTAFERPTLLKSLLVHAQSLYVQAAVTAACNARHLLPQRLARWLLVAGDRTGAGDLPLRHEFLSYMLGVRRAGVTEALIALKTAGLVDTSRGNIRLLNRTRLEKVACSCYRIAADR